MTAPTRAEAIYRSNDGRGPLRARVVADDGERVRLYRWDEKRGDKARVYFTLPVWFLGSPSCGWRAIR